ncbi:DsbA family protein [Paenibacillus ginsengarvi]|uniref:DsbA family protein n=1 Tax=Paenibacillus ginsengarvi TaxID=400777 RepID=A0A3B0C842_9BACL|nr:DsbA family protein [Paenibacillus ginsengarvi]RKN82143.1 DsbA family protein [Paenibacillus ginsengarvi]
MSSNNMMCDLETGVCGDAGEDAVETIDWNEPQRQVQLYYVTDPICSHCWALEPVLRRFETQFGHYVRVRTVMGGLLASWDGFADAGNGISRPADVAGHWREVGEHSRMPIDGSLWLDNPVLSSYPPSRVFKVLQQKDEKLAGVFLRRAREAVFVWNRNIGQDQVLTDIVNAMGLDGAAIVEEAGSSEAQEMLEADFALSRSLGARGFPTIVLVNEERKGVKIVGARPLETYVAGLRQALLTEALQAKPVPELAVMLQKEERLFSKEIEILYDLEQQEVGSFVQKELPSGSYTEKHILGEVYMERT